ncbi:CRISPR-associated endonuclease Cas1 [Sphaerotilus uruguayifluvii]|uniref:CRISPR-associated endonuclease Cas1 n=1 Tax=Sphaerotilus uruguayifluvii TaxID=2735897 RepID=A0ABX2G7P2_9BURK|nr:CRISPR-associated endonuclease Cas1 [Leptothrix sp. C29]NRT58045.1 CRISPR-associated protein Cas1 [Leptothrix sp. C29]
MSTLLLDRSNLEVRTDGAALALYEAGVRRGSVPLKLIDRCVIHGQQTRLDSGVLLRLAEAGASTVLLSPRTGRRVAIVLGPAHNEAAVRLAQAQRVMDPGWCVAWARAVVQAKLDRQARTLARWRQARPDARQALTRAERGLAAARTALAALDPAAAPGFEALATLRGLEGQAARAHFAGLAAVLPPALGFAGRNRRPPRDPVNACLSLGYTLLHAEAVSATQAAGLDPLLGFYHRPAFGRESLASDLIEPLRAEVDAWVAALLRDRTLREDHFTLPEAPGGACLLGKAGRQIFYARWAGEAVRPLRRWLRWRSAALARVLRAQGLADLALGGADSGPDDDEAGACAVPGVLDDHGDLLP